MVHIRPTFSGHESFQCRHLWLKKGYDFVNSGKSFSESDAVVFLGVGKNMVNSIRFWMRAFDLLDSDDKLTPFAHSMFSAKGFDPYLEDDASLWLLHYNLVKKGYATTYSLIFNEMRKERMEFSKDNFVRFVQLKSESEMPFTFNKNTISSDFDVFVKLYIGTETIKDREDVVSGVFPELGMVKTITRDKLPTQYVIEDSERVGIPDDLILYILLSDDSIGSSVSLDMLERDYNSIGAIFAMNRTGIMSKIEGLCAKYPYLVYRDDSGVRELQFKKKPKAETILKAYYAGKE